MASRPFPEFPKDQGLKNGIRREAKKGRFFAQENRGWKLRPAGLIEVLPAIVLLDEEIEEARTKSEGVDLERWRNSEGQARAAVEQHGSRTAYPALSGVHVVAWLRMGDVDPALP